MTVQMKGMGDWLRLACALILLSLGFAHKPIGAGASIWAGATSVVADSAYAGQICIGGTDGQQPAVPGWHGCDACLVTSGAMLPSPPADHLRAPSLSCAIDFPLIARAEPHRALRPGSPVRGPPVLFA